MLMMMNFELASWSIKVSLSSCCAGSILSKCQCWKTKMNNSWGALSIFFITNTFFIIPVLHSFDPFFPIKIHWTPQWTRKKWKLANHALINYAPNSSQLFEYQKGQPIINYLINCVTKLTNLFRPLVPPINLLTHLINNCGYLWCVMWKA